MPQPRPSNSVVATPAILVAGDLSDPWPSSVLAAQVVDARRARLIWIGSRICGTLHG
jgi:hypothetical protein